MESTNSLPAEKPSVRNPRDIKDRRQCLQEKINAIYDAIADDAGMNITYCESIDGDMFLSVLAVAANDFEDFSRKACFDNCLFLASNNFILPKSLANSSEKEIEDYIHNNEDSILDNIEKNAVSDYLGRFQCLNLHCNHNCACCNVE